MKNYSRKQFNYSDTKWGIIPITSFKKNLQGYELEYLLRNSDICSKKKIKILDIGCGGGNILGFLSSKLSDVEAFGLDVSRTAIKYAEIAFPKIKFLETKTEKLPFKDNYFDCVICLDVFEHIKNYQKTISEVKRVLKNDGFFYLSVPLEKQFLTLYWLGNITGIDKLKRESVGHINVFNNKEIISLFENSGFIKEKSCFGGHFIFSIFDYLYYFLIRKYREASFSFESSVNQMKKGTKRNFLEFIKTSFAIITYFESKLFKFVPGGKGHYIFRKCDFFSVKPPVTVCEDLQLKNGLSKVIRPKDLVIKKFINSWKIKKNQTILDFGTANGVWLERLLRSTKCLGIGVDISKNLIDKANKRKDKKGKYFLNDDQWPLSKNSVDYCVSFDVFEHIKDKDKEVVNIYNSLKKKGKFLFYTLNPNNKFTFDWLFEKLGSNYLYKRADHDKRIYINPKAFKKLLKEKGFIKVGYLYFDGPANLFWEVLPYSFFKVIEPIFRKLKTKWLTAIFYQINDLLMRVINPMNKVIDMPFVNNKCSNGYFIWGEK